MSNVLLKHGPISVVILDLDNTLWDWVDLWCRSFRAMLDRLVLDSGVPEDRLVVEIKQIHEKYGTSEYAFLIQELPALRAKHPGEDLSKVYESAIRAFREERLRALSLYPGVLETLETIKDAGALIIGFTDSRAFYTASRMRRLGLDRIFDYLYSPPDHQLPGGRPPETFRMYESAYYELRRTRHRYTSENERKPNPEILLKILSEVGAKPEQVVYVGDNLSKDVVMAQQAGVLAGWAKYGRADERPEYELLRRVTHWPASAVQEEKTLSEDDVMPALVLAQGLSDLLNLCEFTSFRSSTSEREALVVTIWSKVIDVQQHFNDLELRIRNYAVTLLTAIVGASAFALKEDLTLLMAGLAVSVAATLLVAGAFSWLAFYLMDRFWYHRLLYGAVKHAETIEANWGRELPELGLTARIGAESPITIFGHRLRTPRKIDLFYAIVFSLTVLLAIVVQLGSTRKATLVGERLSPLSLSPSNMVPSKTVPSKTVDRRFAPASATTPTPSLRPSAKARVAIQPQTPVHSPTGRPLDP